MHLIKFYDAKAKNYRRTEIVEAEASRSHYQRAILGGRS